MEFFLNDDIFCSFYRITRKPKKNSLAKILPQVGLDLRHLRLSIIQHKVGRSAIIKFRTLFFLIQIIKRQQFQQPLLCLEHYSLLQWIIEDTIISDFMLFDGWMFPQPYFIRISRKIHKYKTPLKYISCLASVAQTCNHLTAIFKINIVRNQIFSHFSNHMIMVQMNFYHYP